MEEIRCRVGRGQRSHVGARRELDREVPQEVVVPVDVHADLRCDTTRTCRVAVLAPHRLGAVGQTGHAVRTSVRVDVGEDDDVRAIDDEVDGRCRERLAAVRQPRVRGVGLEQVCRQIDQDVGPAPLTSVHAADENERRPALETRIAPNEQRIAVTVLGRLIGQRQQPGDGWIGLVQCDERGFDLGDVEEGHDACPPCPSRPSGSRSSPRPSIFRPRPRGVTRPPSKRSPCPTSVTRSRARADMLAPTSTW